MLAEVTCPLCKCMPMAKECECECAWPAHPPTSAPQSSYLYGQSLSVTVALRACQAAHASCRLAWPPFSPLAICTGCPSVPARCLSTPACSMTSPSISALAAAKTGRATNTGRAKCKLKICKKPNTGEIVEILGGSHNALLTGKLAAQLVVYSRAAPCYSTRETAPIYQHIDRSDTN